MRVFLTGATGFVGTAVIRELVGAGHQVLGLAYNDAGAKKLEAAKVAVHRGSLDDLASLKAGVKEADAVIHCAFVHDFSNFLASCEKEGHAVAAMGEVLGKRPMIITSGTALVSATGNEKEILQTSHNPRIVSEKSADALVASGHNVSVMRLPPTVHDENDKGFIRSLVLLARQTGVSAYVGDGKNHWGAVHRPDAARLYQLLIEKGTPGTRAHAVGETVPFKDIASKIGARLGVPVASKTPEEAQKHFGWLAHFAAVDNRVSSAITRERFGWDPKGKTLLQDLDGDSYFRPE